jgi:hypothetical protein
LFFGFAIFFCVVSARLAARARAMEADAPKALERTARREQKKRTDSVRFFCEAARPKNLRK